MDTDIEKREAELPPIESSKVKAQGDIGDQGEPIKSMGSERNPEFLQTGGHQSAGSSPPTKSTITDGSNTGDDNRVSNNDSPISTVGQLPQIADDIDLIEKEWVEKAKEIVEKTKENPYLQNKAISEIKTDYIQKRYGKKIAKSEN